jgi:cathepsin E
MLLLAPFAVLATDVAANPIVARGSPTCISLAITKRLNVNGTLNVVQRDQARLATMAMFTWSTLASVIPVSLVNFCLVVSYMPILDELIVDTGSSNTWVGANKAYQLTQSSEKTSDFVVSIVSRRIPGLAQTKTRESESNIWLWFFQRLVLSQES